MISWSFATWLSFRTERICVHLSRLAALMRHPQVMLSREQLIEAIWGGDSLGEHRLVDNLVCRAREKLAGAGCEGFPIATAGGVGYACRPEGKRPRGPGHGDPVHRGP